jgi:hypothetical protein
MTDDSESFVTEKYEVSLTRVFDADSYEDALFQMVNYMTHHADESHFHVTNLSIVWKTCPGSPARNDPC